MAKNALSLKCLGPGVFDRMQRLALCSCLRLSFCDGCAVYSVEAGHCYVHVGLTLLCCSMIGYCIWYGIINLVYFMCTNRLEHGFEMFICEEVIC